MIAAFQGGSGVRGFSFFTIVALFVSGCATQSQVEPPKVVWPKGDSSSTRYAGLLPTVDAVVASGAQQRKAKLVLDTGCEGVALSSSLVAALDLPNLHRLVRYEGSPVEKGGVGRGQTLSHGLGRVEVPGCFLLEGGEAIQVKMPGGFDALAGLVAFPGRAIVFEPATNRVHFVTRELSDQLAAVEGATALPTRRKHNTLRVKVRVGALEAELLVDTGARYSWVSPSIARGAAVNGVRGTVQGRLYSGRADLGLRILKVESDGSLEGGLGSDILLGLGRAVLLDLERERVVLLPVLPSSSSR